MTSTTTSSTPAATSSRNWWLSPVFYVVLVALGLYTFMLSQMVGAYCGGSDSSGYMNSAKLLEKGKTRMPQRVIEGVNFDLLQETTFVPLGFRPIRDVPEKIMAPTYPTGIPLFILFFTRFFSWETAPAVMIIAFSLLGILGTAWFAKEFGLSTGAAWLVAGLLAIGPIYINLSLQLMSDVPAMAFCVLTMAVAWKSRSHPAWATAAGAFFALSVLVRPNDIVMILPAAFCFGISWRCWFCFGLGGLPGGVFFGIYNHFAYGNALVTGYGSLENYFALKWIPITVVNYVRWLPFLLTPIGVLALGIPFLYKRHPVEVKVLGSWIFALLGFYAIDRDTHQDMWILRYLLPAFPAFLVGGVWVLKAIMESKMVEKIFERPARALPVLALAGIVWIAAIGFCVWAGHEYRHEPNIIIHYALPALPILVAVWLSLKILQESDRTKLLVNAVVSQLLVVMVILTLFKSALLGVWTVREGEILYPLSNKWVNENLPANAILCGTQMSGSVLYYTPFTFVRRDWMYGAAWEEIKRAAAAQKRPIYLFLFAFELKDRPLDMFAPGNWKDVPGVGKAAKGVVVMQLQPDGTAVQ